MSAPHLLIVGPSWVGDMVMAQSLFKAIKQQTPDTRIDVLAPGWSLALLERMPEVEQGIEMPVGHGQLKLGTRWKLGRTLKGRYQQAILLPNSLKSALIPWFARIPKRTGWLGESRHLLLNDIRHLDPDLLSMTVQRFVALADEQTPTDIPEIIAPELNVRVADVQAALSKHQLSKRSATSVLILCPGAEYGSAKRWPAASFAELAKRYLAQNWQVWLFGSNKDQAVCAEINQLVQQGCIDLSGQTSLSEAVDLMSIADAVVSNDSGLMHVAAAVQRPLVAIYGSSDPNFTPPLNSNHQIVSLGLDCSPCFKRECPLQHLDCLKQISVDQVQQAMHRLLN